MPSLTRAAVGAFAVILLAADQAAAGPFNVGFDVGAASDYPFRGISQTVNRPDLFGGADATIGAIGYAGTWLSNVDFRNGTRLEYDLYGGVRPTLGPVTLDLGVVRYGYAGQRSGAREDYTEWKVAPSMGLGPATLGLAYFHSWDFFGDAGPSNYVEASIAAPLGRSPFSFSAALGRQQMKGPSDYTTWNLGVSYAMSDRFGFDLRYWDTDSHGLGGAYRAKLVVGLKATFP